MPQQDDPLEFTADQFTDVREGYLTLDWNTVDAAAYYSVTDQDARELFRGAAPQAFISGLPNGNHRFTVTAVDGQGQIVAQSSAPAAVTVQHWSLSFATSLLVCGSIVLMAVIGVLVWGTRVEASSKAPVA